MDTDLATIYQPKDDADAMKKAAFLANSSFVPPAFKGKVNDVYIAMALGATLGLNYIQALQNIAVINGRPCIWGDLLVAIVRRHPDFESMQVFMDKDKPKDTVAVCIIKRKNQPAHKETFSEEDARRAGLWGRNVWAKYPKRMLQVRARAFAIRNVFADAMMGLQVREEVEDYEPIKNITPETVSTNVIEESPIENKDVSSPLGKHCPKINPSKEKEYNRTLQDLIKLHSIDYPIVKRWIDAANVSDVSELNAEQTEGCLNWIYKQYPEKQKEPSDDRAQSLAEELKSKGDENDKTND